MKPYWTPSIVQLWMDLSAELLGLILILRPFVFPLSLSTLLSVNESNRNYIFNYLKRSLELKPIFKNNRRLNYFEGSPDYEGFVLSDDFNAFWACGIHYSK